MNLKSAENLARDLLDRHGLEKWKFKFDRARVRSYFFSRDL